MFAAYTIYVFIYADDGYIRYIPKRHRLRYRLAAYLAYLRSWLKIKLHKPKQVLARWRMQRLLRRILRHHGNTDYHSEGAGGIQIPLQAQQLLAHTAILAQQASIKSRYTNFILDSDSKALGIDNRATAFISGDIDDFEGPLIDSDRVVKGFGGTKVKGVKQGTAVLRIEDDTGRVHRVRLRRSYYVPGSPDRLFSPQHFAQEMKRHYKGQVSETTNDTHCILRWGPYTRTIPLDPITNVATFRTAPSYAKFNAYCAEAGFNATDEFADPIAFDAALVSDDDDSDTDLGFDSGPTEDPQSRTSARGGETWQDSHLPNTVVPRQQPAIIEQEEIESKAQLDEAKLLEYHYKFNHAPFSKLQIMAKRGVLPTRLARCRVPVCAACMYGKATKKPWRSKQANNRDEAFIPTKPGQVVAVDQLKSPTPGFVAQLTGALTTDRYNYATVFVDAFSNWGYVHLQKTQSGNETLDAKRAFERLCERNGVRVMHYHADNGVFRSKVWMDDCQSKGQGMSFAGVDAHHQNGRAEAKIRRLQEMTRTSLLHARRKWPQEISANLWPYALRMANDSINATPSLQDVSGRTPEQLFSTTEVETNPKHWIHFGSPVFVLDPALRGTTRIHAKWKDRANIGIYLGRSPQHSRSVALVLNPETGLVSPQFHVKHDGNFDTIQQLYNAKANHTSKWQLKAGLVKLREVRTGDTVENNVDDHRNSENHKRGDSEGAELPTGDKPGTARTRDDARPSAPAASRIQRDVTIPTASGNATGGRQPPPVDVRTSRQDNLTTEPRTSSRTRRPVQRLIEAMMTELSQDTSSNYELFSYQAMFPRDDHCDIEPTLYAMKAKADPDTLYLHEARRQPDWADFSDAMQLEIEQQVSTGLYTIIKRSELPEGATVLPSVWQLRRKRDVRTGQVKKHKARCNIDGSHMRYGEHYEQTYAPVAGWTAIRLVLAFILLLCWHAVTLDYVLAYPQAPAVRLLYMEIPKGFTLDGVEHPEDYVLQINRNI